MNPQDQHKKVKNTNRFFYRSTIAVLLLGALLFVFTLATRLQWFHSYAHMYFYWAMLLSLAMLLVYFLIFTTTDAAENKSLQDDIEVAHARSWRAVGVDIRSMFSEGSTDFFYTLTLVVVTLECAFFAVLHYWTAFTQFMQQFLVS